MFGIGDWATTPAAPATQPASVPIKARRILGILSKLGLFLSGCWPTSLGGTIAKRRTPAIPATHGEAGTTHTSVSFGIIVIPPARHERFNDSGAHPGLSELPSSMALRRRPIGPIRPMGAIGP